MCKCPFKYPRGRKEVGYAAVENPDYDNFCGLHNFYMLCIGEDKCSIGGKQ